MGIPDNQFDDYLSLSLQTQTLVARRQKDRAWERLQKQARRQVMLAPYAIQPATRQHKRLTDRIRHMFAVLLTDDTRYYRAAETRHLTPITAVVGVGLMLHGYFPFRYHAY